jgi:hypothetical protein
MLQSLMRIAFVHTHIYVSFILSLKAVVSYKKGDMYVNANVHTCTLKVCTSVTIKKQNPELNNLATHAKIDK